MSPSLAARWVVSSRGRRWRGRRRGRERRVWGASCVVSGRRGFASRRAAGGRRRFARRTRRGSRARARERARLRPNGRRRRGAREGWRLRSRGGRRRARVRARARRRGPRGRGCGTPRRRHRIRRGRWRGGRRRRRGTRSRRTREGNARGSNPRSWASPGRGPRPPSSSRVARLTRATPSTVVSLPDRARHDSHRRPTRDARVALARVGSSRAGRRVHRLSEDANAHSNDAPKTRGALV